MTVSGKGGIRRKNQEHYKSLKSLDALHIACAEGGNADIFLSTDDKLINASKRNKRFLKIEAENPLIWLQKEI
ncbi:hypothetical protein EPICR_20284 [Candidatus Desulfarcum epimagneticum]|uniref:PIN domain-containing protein n=1 Tax=uncultured Desulfobacteraceae bacterium TaxID=218296 RepID=A0A484HJQ6_9BACT|nr:hypothetical protein EPICR_20284 [uncultured Desulfobacteraceae bacterium]